MKKSAGILAYRLRSKEPEIFLVHPGGPFWKNKDDGAWSVPKGEFMDDEDPLEAAKREFEEETGISINGKFIELEPVKQKGGKLVLAWAIEKDIDPDKIKSNLFSMEWPPKSGKMQEFPEVDKGKWCDIREARQKINPSQASLIDQLTAKLSLK
ncbi:MAG TPA: NUDIX domain-containing protein [Chitinophagaceae bacterium]|nr:NUDIX domain-containing protein [Chitinophagaceae bacterium]